MCFCVIFYNIDRFSTVISSIFLSAFSFKSAAGGITAIAIKEGFARGILSNEAGVGTSAMAHLRSGRRSPHLAGLFGMCEVFFDTTLLCSLTGLAILLSVDNISAFETPMSLVFKAFSSSLGAISVLLLPIIFAFAYATLICWFYYGVEYCRLYFGVRREIFLLAFLSFVLLAHLLPSVPLLSITDFVLLFMAILTLAAVVKKVDRICFLSKNKELH
jgi:AGCS family alanine or glycine:cation symporter